MSLWYNYRKKHKLLRYKIIKKNFNYYVQLLPGFYFNLVSFSLSFLPNLLQHNINNSIGSRYFNICHYPNSPGNLQLTLTHEYGVHSDPLTKYNHKVAPKTKIPTLHSYHQEKVGTGPLPQLA